MSQKISLRFFNDREIRAVWDEAGNQWWFAVVDIVAAVSESSSPQNYWYVLKNRLKKAKNEGAVTKPQRFATAPFLCLYSFRSVSFLLFMCLFISFFILISLRVSGSRPSGAIQ